METCAVPRLTPPAGELVVACLERIDGRVTNAGPDRWRFARPGEHKARTDITVLSDRVEVERALPGDWFASRARTLRRSLRLLDPQLSAISGARPVLLPGETKARIRAERFIVPARRDEPALLARWIDTACYDAAALAGGAPKVDARVNADAPEATGPSQEEILGLCELGGWPAEARGKAGQVTITLPARSGGACFGVAAADGDTVRIDITLEVPEEAQSPSCQAAVSFALLRVAGCVRLVRSTATRDDRGISAGLNVRLQPPLDVATLNHGLSALAVAHQQIAAELEALAGDDLLADAYLRVQGAG